MQFKEENKSREVNVYLEICREGITLPEYAHLYDAGMDVCAACDISLLPGETKLIPTGLKMAIPEGYEIQVRPRSGLSLNTPLRLSNSPGTIDTGYRDEICVILTNISPAAHCENIFHISEKGNKPGIYNILKGDRIAQLVLCEVPRIKFIMTDDVKNIGTDRGGGFGSSGI